MTSACGFLATYLLIHYTLFIWIGMQQTPEFANGLLGALRGKRDRNSGITKSELCNYWRRITDSCFNSRMRIFFNLYALAMLLKIMLKR